MEESFSQFPQILVGWMASLFGDNPSWDILLLLGAAVVVVLLGFWGRARITAVTIASYMAIALLATTPTFDWAFSSLSIPITVTGIAGVFLAVTAALFFVVNYCLGELFDEDDGYLASSMVLAVATVGMALSYALTILPVESLGGFSPAILALLTGTGARILWILAPMVVIGASLAK